MSATIPNQRKRILPNIPAYRRIEADLRERIVNGHWPLGGILPSRRDLAKEYGVDALTLSRAMAPLLEDGTVRAQGGRGTFVARVGDKASITHAAAPDAILRSDNFVPLQPRASRRLHATVCIIAPIRVDMEEWIGKDLYWPSIVVHALEQAFADETDVALQFKSVHEARSDLQIPLTDILASIDAAATDSVICVLPSQPGYAEAILAFTELTGIPVVALVEQAINQRIAHVFHDLRFAGFQAASHLIQRDYSKITYFVPFDDDWVEERRIGIEQAVQRAGISPLRVIKCAPQSAESHAMIHQREIAVEAARKALLDGWVPNGVIAANDYVASGVIKAAAEVGLVAGRDYGIVGFDSRAESRAMGLTSFYPPLEAMGREAGRMVIQKLNGHTPPTQIGLQPHLIHRESSRRQRNGNS